MAPLPCSTAGEPLFYEEQASGPHAAHVITEDDSEVGRWGRWLLAAGLSCAGSGSGSAACCWLAGSLIFSLANTFQPHINQLPQVVAMVKELLETRIRPAVQVRPPCPALLRVQPLLWTLVPASGLGASCVGRALAAALAPPCAMWGEGRSAGTGRRQASTAAAAAAAAAFLDG